MKFVLQTAKRVALWVPAIRRLVEEKRRLVREREGLLARLAMARLFFHPRGQPVPWPAGFDVDEGPFDRNLIERIATACRAGGDRPPPSASDHWGFIVNGHSEIVSSLVEGRLEAAHEYLRRQYAKPPTNGFQQGHVAHGHLLHEESAREHMRYTHADRLLRLAEAFGVMPVANPEQGGSTKGFEMSPDDLLGRVEREFGARLQAPRGQGDLFGLRTSRGIFTERHFAAIYLAKRISEICPDRKSRICEIGAGAGYLAYYCRKLGYQDFTIVDLPSVNISQAYLLMRALPETEFRLQGEAGPFEPGDAIRILPDSALQSAPEGCFDLVVNVDSLPEMATPVALELCKTIARVGRRFLSVNQEANAPRTTPQDLQDRVPEMVLRVGGYRRLSRAPFWMREGYVEELYSVEASTGGDRIVLFEDMSDDYAMHAEGDRPYLDRPLDPAKEATLDAQQRFWRENGYLILERFMPEEIVDAYVRVRQAFQNPSGWGPVPYLYYDEIKDFCLHKPLVALLEKLIGDRVILHLNLTGWVSSQRNWHQDDYLNPPHVRGSYLAVWAALDTIHPDCGPFEFVPGSHRWRVLNREKVRARLSPFEAAQEGLLGHKGHWAEFSEKMVSDSADDYIARKGGKVTQFLGKKGDVLIWHGCLLHRGSLPKVPGMPRKSLIAHYSGVTNREDFAKKHTWTYAKTGGLYQHFDIPLVY